jgi:hypothetical protein
MDCRRGHDDLEAGNDLQLRAWSLRPRLGRGPPFRHSRGPQGQRRSAEQVPTRLEDMVIEI